MKKEIGSEFCIYFGNHEKKHNAVIKHDLNLLSGRTAIDLIIKDIRRNRTFSRVYMPSYCCESMIQPFLINGVEVVFYDITVNKDFGLNYVIPDLCKNDVLFIMDYFGFYSKALDTLIHNIRNNILIIEDKTHSFFNNVSLNRSCYSFASIRKWVGALGIAVLHKQNEAISLQDDLIINSKYVELRKEAFKLKKQYQDNQFVDKKKFLELFSQAEELLEIDYAGYSADEESVKILESLDVDSIRKTRINNARMLIDGLKNSNLAKLIFSSVSDMECPLFVPVIVDKSKRDLLQRYLISKNIYCPIHWPQTKYHSGIGQETEFIYERGLSIICDQRYQIDDMEHILYEIRKFELLS